ncbi:MAG: glycerol-3-phosphate 1-O-acyltransferase PlsY [Candidatus Melainabacteria bacterium]|nr:glycerol-3-phosphate 1-O-acyltransferase PlsY [Candidatus Melainabacteria bacterium]
MFPDAILSRACSGLSLSAADTVWLLDIGHLCWVLLYVLATYLLGAIPTGYIVAKQAKGIDIREHGSGNPGATNVFRVVGKKEGLLTLLLDFLKGLLPVMLARVYVFPEAYWVHLLVAMAPSVGHSRSVFLNFKGGKSAITSLGIIFGLAPLGGLLLAIIAGTIIYVTRYVSVGSMIAALLTPLLLGWLGYPVPYIMLAAVCGLLVVVLHRPNIQRLLQGTENRIS